MYIEYYSAGDIFTKFVKFYPLARFASSRCSELSAAFGDLRACYRGRVRITVALASAVISIYDGMTRKTGCLKIILPDIAET